MSLRGMTYGNSGQRSLRVQPGFRTCEELGITYRPGNWFQHRSCMQLGRRDMGRSAPNSIPFTFQFALSLNCQCHSYLRCNTISISHWEFAVEAPSSWIISSVYFANLWGRSFLMVCNQQKQKFYRIRERWVRVYWCLHINPWYLSVGHLGVSSAWRESWVSENSRRMGDGALHEAQREVGLAPLREASVTLDNIKWVLGNSLRRSFSNGLYTTKTLSLKLR